MSVNAVFRALWKSVRLGVLVGLAFAVTWTTIICIWEWVENIPGIFHDENGTNWNFVFDTAISWFLPTFIYPTLLFVACSFAYRLFRLKFPARATGQ